MKGGRVVPTETDEFGQFFKCLKERWLTGVRLVISDAHRGLKGAARKVLKQQGLPPAAPESSRILFCRSAKIGCSRAASMKY